MIEFSDEFIVSFKPPQSLSASETTKFLRETILQWESEGNDSSQLISFFIWSPLTTEQQVRRLAAFCARYAVTNILINPDARLLRAVELAESITIKSDTDLRSEYGTLENPVKAAAYDVYYKDGKDDLYAEIILGEVCRCVGYACSTYKTRSVTQSSVFNFGCALGGRLHYQERERCELKGETSPQVYDFKSEEVKEDINKIIDDLLINEIIEILGANPSRKVNSWRYDYFLKWRQSETIETHIEKIRIQKEKIITDKIAKELKEKNLYITEVIAKQKITSLSQDEIEVIENSYSIEDSKNILKKKCWTPLETIKLMATCMEMRCLDDRLYNLALHSKLVSLDAYQGELIAENKKTRGSFIWSEVEKELIRTAFNATFSKHALNKINWFIGEKEELIDKANEIISRKRQKNI